MPALRDLGVIVLTPIKYVAFVVRLALVDCLGIVTIFNLWVGIGRVQHGEESFDSILNPVA